MNLLRTARVILVEDEETEATPLLLALSKLGIGTWHFTGDAEALPDSPVEGARIVFVDLRLGGVAVTTEPRHRFAQTISILDKIIGPSKGSVGIVFWTKNEEDIDAFLAQLQTDLPDFVPSFVKRLENKLQFLTAVAANGVSLMDILKTVLEVKPSSQLLFEWEQAVHDATSATTNRLTKLASGENGDADACLMKLLAALAVSTGAETEIDETLNVVRLFESLNPIHSDHLEQLTLRRSKADAGSNALKAEVEKQESLSSQTKAAINGFILTARAVSGDPPFQPGAIYLPKPGIGVKCPHDQTRMPLEELARSILQHTKDPEFNSALNSSRSKKITPEKQADGLKACIERENYINAECKKFLLEISPACDFAQGKRATARFLGGLLIPEKYFGLVRSGDYLREIEPVVINELGGTWLAVLNSRFIFGVSNPCVKMESHPAFRLRNPLLVDILAWLGGQVSRPGYVSLR